MTNQKMPDEINLFRCEGEGDIKWSEDSTDALATYINKDLYAAACAERDELRELCEGMDLALRDLAAYVGCWTHSTDKGRQEVSFPPTDPRGLLCERAKSALAACAERDELWALCGGLARALENAKHRLEGAGMLGGLTDPVVYQLAAYETVKKHKGVG